MRVLVRLLALVAVIFASPYVLSAVRVGGLASALVAALVYALLAVFVGWAVRAVVTVLAIVPGVLTFGLFFLLIPILVNGVLLKLTAGLMPSFGIRTWTAAFLLGAAVTFVNALLDRADRRRR